MKEYLLELAVRKAEEILKKVSAASLEPLREEALSQWVDYEAGPSTLDSIAAVDGSQNAVEFKGFTLYAVLAYGTGAYFSRGDVVTRLVGDIDVLQPPGVPGMVQLYRELAEAIAAYLLSDSALLMVDGSIRALLIHPRPLANTERLNKALARVEELFGTDFYGNLWERVGDRLRSFTRSGEIYEPFVSKELMLRHGLTGADNMDVAALIGYLEKLMVLRALVEKASLRRDGRGLVYVSKTSRSQLYFRDVIGEEGVVPVVSDMLVFASFTRSAGYSKPLLQSETVEGGDAVLKALPSRGELSSIIKEFFDRVDYVISYVRLVDGGPLLKLEIPVPSGSGRAEELVRWYINSMAPTITGGYPYPLIEADRMAKITRKDMLVLLRSLGILPSLTGREVLEGWL